MSIVTPSLKYAQIGLLLNEKQWRQYLALEAKENGNILGTALAAGVSRNTIKEGIREIEAGKLYAPGSRIRKEGAGRKAIAATDPSLLPDLEAATEPKGDPMSPLRWTTKSLSNLVDTLEQKGHTIKKSALALVLASQGFSLKANKKNIEGVSHIDRDAQFRHIATTVQAFEAKQDPVISIDCKKKELIGNFKNNGREWQPKGSSVEVSVYDFKSLADGKAVPYGVYDILQNAGFVNVGASHDTAAFAVESIRRWWQSVGHRLYPGKTRLLVTADGGGSNGTRNRLWRKELQKFSDETGLEVTVCHLPPATSKWNKIEHRLFAYISINWRAKPLVSLEAVIELICHTTTKEGLRVTAVVDQNSYPIGIKVSDEEMGQLNIQKNEFHPEWNYVVKPRDIAPC